jgi:hypothetical protein
MRESSPAVGGAMMFAAVVCSLAYVMGDTHALMEFAVSLTHRAGDAGRDAIDNLRQMLAGTV